jgi:hypothetical protein
MNHRRALRATTDATLTIFLVMAIGVILWTTDEVLNWNILPDWIDKYAQLLVIILSTLAGLAGVMSVVCSLAVLAESAAQRAGLPEPKTPRKVKWLLLSGVAAFVGLVVVFQAIDHYREGKRKIVAAADQLARYTKIRSELQEPMDHFLGLFSGTMKEAILRMDAGDEAEIAKLLTAIRSSTPHQPRVSLLVRSTSPYQYCAMEATEATASFTEGAKVKPLARQFYVDLPERWERDTIRAMFEGARLDVPPDRPGVFINTRSPSAWGLIEQDGRVIGILMLRGSR